MASRKKGAAKRVGTVKGSALNGRRGRKSTNADRRDFMKQSGLANSEAKGTSAKAKAIRAAGKKEISKSTG